MVYKREDVDVFLHGQKEVTVHIASTVDRTPGNVRGADGENTLIRDNECLNIT
jgi:hypothetical protein